MAADASNKRTTVLVQNLEKQCSDFVISPNLIKLLSGFTAAITFGFGIKSALKYTKDVPPEELTRVKIISGAGFATKALATATILTVSGFTLVVLGVSIALNVNTPKQFGSRMKELFGDSLKISNTDPNVKKYDTLTELFEDVSSKKEN
uniref:Transmembrane protein 242 n=1 Tax=Strongyloides papillosus TaxID=174720 RepID=A0A0N5B777_STREA